MEPAPVRDASSSPAAVTDSSVGPQPRPTIPKEAACSSSPAQPTATSPPVAVMVATTTPLLPPRYPTDPWRFAALATFCLLSSSNGMQWITYANVIPQVEWCYGVSGTLVNALSLVYTLVYVLGAFFACHVLNYYGLKRGLRCGSALNVIGASLKCLSLFVPGKASPSYALLMVAQICNSMSQLFFLGAPPLLAASWFSDEARTKATAVASMANNVGIAVGLFLPPILVSLQPPSASPATTTNSTTNFTTTTSSFMQQTPPSNTMVMYGGGPLFVSSSSSTPASSPAPNAAVCPDDLWRQFLVLFIVQLVVVTVEMLLSCWVPARPISPPSYAAELVWSRLAADDEPRGGAGIESGNGGGGGASSASLPASPLGSLQEAIPPLSSRSVNGELVGSTHRRGQGASFDTITDKDDSTSPPLPLMDEHRRATTVSHDVTPHHAPTETRPRTARIRSRSFAAFFTELIATARRVVQALREQEGLALLTLSVGFSLATMWSLSSVILQLLLPFGVQATVVGTMGLVNILLGTALAYVAGLAVDRYRVYRGPLVACYVSCAVCIGAFAAASWQLMAAWDAESGRGPEDSRPIADPSGRYAYYAPLVFALYVLLGVFQNAAVPIAFEYAVEISFPVDESISGTLLMLSGNFFTMPLLGGLTILLQSTPTPRGMSLLGIGIVLVVLVLAVAMLCFVRAPLKRLMAERERRLPQ